MRRKSGILRQHQALVDVAYTYGPKATIKWISWVRRFDGLQRASAFHLTKGLNTLSHFDAFKPHFGSMASAACTIA